MRNIALLTVLLLSSASPQTLLRGDISDIQFTAEKNPYVIEEDITIPEGKRAEIKAGCILLFKPFTGITAEGTLVIDGTPEQMVILTSFNDSVHNKSSEQAAAPFDWNGLLISEKNDSVYFRNFTLSYSVFGINSKSPDVRIKNGIFYQNGQFHFTIADKILPELDSVPFTHNAIEAKIDSLVTIPANVTAPHQEQNKSIGAVKIRFLSLGLGITGLAACAIAAYQTRSDHQHWVETSVEPDKWDQYDSAEKRYTRSLTLTVVSGAVGLIGMAGFGISFTF